MRIRQSPSGKFIEVGGGGAPYSFQASYKPGTGLGGAGGAPNTYQQYIPGGPNSDVIQGLTQRFIVGNGFLVYRADNTAPGRFLITVKFTVTGGTQDILFTIDHNDEIIVGLPPPDTIPGWVRISDSGASVNGQYTVSRIFDAQPDDTFCLLGLMPAAGGGTNVSQFVWEALEVADAFLPVI